MKILVHTCCAPCLIHPLKLLTRRGYEVVPFFYNPNIQPFREYRERYFAVCDYCRENGLDLHTGAYDMESFLRELSEAAQADSLRGAIAGKGKAIDRCRGCYKMRLDRTAVAAAALGIRDFTTTLLVSPYQDRERIKNIGEQMSVAHGVMFLYEDMTDGFRDAMQESRELGMYRQSYCGCVYSEKERYQKSDPPIR